MPDHDPDRLRKFRRDRINEPGLVRIVTDRQTTTTTARLSPLSLAIEPSPISSPAAPGVDVAPSHGGDPPNPPPLTRNPCYAKTLFAHSRYAKTLAAPNGDFHYLSDEIKRRREEGKGREKRKAISAMQWRGEESMRTRVGLNTTIIITDSIVL